MFKLLISKKIAVHNEYERIKEEEENVWNIVINRDWWRLKQNISDQKLLGEEIVEHFLQKL